MSGPELEPVEPFHFLAPKPLAAQSEVTISNTGVLSAIAGAGIAVNQATGNVTISAVGLPLPNLWAGSSFSEGLADVTPGTPVALVALRLQNAGNYVVWAVAALTAPSLGGATFWLQWEDAPVSPDSALVSATATVESGWATSVALSQFVYANTNFRNLVLYIYTDVAGVVVYGTAPPANAANATGVTALQVSVVS